MSEMSAMKWQQGICDRDGVIVDDHFVRAVQILWAQIRRQSIICDGDSTKKSERQEMRDR
jgi:hypothetical protein